MIVLLTEVRLKKGVIEITKKLDFIVDTIDSKSDNPAEELAKMLKLVVQVELSGELNQLIFWADGSGFISYRMIALDPIRRLFEKVKRIYSLNYDHNEAMQIVLKEKNELIRIIYTLKYIPVY